MFEKHKNICFLFFYKFFKKTFKKVLTNKKWCDIITHVARQKRHKSMEAQLSWESICLTSRGSQVRALLFPPYKRGCSASSLYTAWQFSWLERQPVTLEVRGSSPRQVANLPLQLSWQSRGLKIPVSLVRFRPEAPIYADLAHLVERNLAKVEVAGSSPVIRSSNNILN